MLPVALATSLDIDSVSGSDVSYSGTCDSGGVDVGVQITVAGQIVHFDQLTASSGGSFSGTFTSSNAGDHSITAVCTGESSASDSFSIGAVAATEASTTPTTPGAQTPAGEPEERGFPWIWVIVALAVLAVGGYFLRRRQGGM